MLSRISIGWTWLEKTLNSIIDRVNLNQPLGSSTIAIEQSPNGTVLRVVKSQDQQPPQGGGGGQGPTGGQWITVNVLDDQCNQRTIQVWGIPPQ